MTLSKFSIIFSNEDILDEDNPSDQNNEATNLNMPDIQIDLECKLGGHHKNNNNNEQTQAPTKNPIQITIPKISAAIEKFCKNNETTATTPNAEMVGEVKKQPTSKFNDEHLIKQRARESLKFWKEEEEKRKSETAAALSSISNVVAAAQPANGSQNNNNSLSEPISNSVSSHLNHSQNTINNATATFNHENGAKRTSLSTASDFSAATGTNESISSVKRVKDRINIFESKSQQPATSSQPASFKLKKSSNNSLSTVKNNHEAKS